MPVTASTITTALRENLRTTGGQRLYGVVDAAQCVDLAYEAKVLFGKEIRSLFLTEVQMPLWDVAPYLVPIDPHSDYLEHWARRWGSSAGILLVTAADENALLVHLRRIFVVEDEEGQEYFFRFYDPRVLRAFLPTCSEDQLEEFFGPIEQFIVEDDQEETLQRFRKEGVGLVKTPLSIEVGRSELVGPSPGDSKGHARRA